MRIQEITALSPADLDKQLEAAHKELFELRFRLSTKQLVNHQQIRAVKKTIARMKTVARERELAGK